jgi:hypothetical protein
MESLSDFNEKKEMAVFISTASGSERASHSATPATARGTDTYARLKTDLMNSLPYIFTAPAATDLFLCPGRMKIRRRRPHNFADSTPLAGGCGGQLWSRSDL